MGINFDIALYLSFILAIVISTVRIFYSGYKYKEFVESYSLTKVYVIFLSSVLASLALFYLCILLFIFLS